MIGYRGFILGIAAAALFIAGCNGDDSDATATPAATPTSTPTATAAPATATPTATGTAEPTATPTPVAGQDVEPTTPLELLIASLDPEPQPTEVDREVDHAAPPPSDFPAHDRESTVLYDLETGEVREFGPGDGGFFSPDTRYFAWIAHTGATNELRVLDLESGEERTLGDGEALVGTGFFDDRRFQVRGLDGALQLVDVESGTWEDSGELDRPRQSWQLQGDLTLMPEPEAPGRYRLVEEGSPEVIAKFPAFAATFAGPGELLLVTPIEGGDGANADGVPGTANIYVIDIEAVEATFVATVALDTNPILPVGGSAALIAWTDNYCNWPDAAGMTRYLDRDSGEIVQFNVTLWIAGITPDGGLGYGEFGPHVIVNPDTMEFAAVLPEGTIDVNWSPDYRYASRGLAYGHGGHCPP